MEFETYGDVIDAFERDNMGYETLTDYINGNNIKIAEIDMDPMGDLKKALGAKDGGLMVAIQKLNQGGPIREKYGIGGNISKNTPYDPRATTQDFTNALQSVSAGSTYQQQADAKRYARNQAASMLDQAMKSADPNKGPGLQGIYDTFFKNKLGTNFQKTFSPGASGRMMSYSSQDRDKMLDQMANQMLDTTNYSQSKVDQRREKEFADYMNNLISSTYGKADDYKAEAATLGMPTEAYFDYFVTSDPKNVMSSYDTLSRDPYFDPKTYVARDPNEAQELSPLNMYYQRELQNQINAGIPEGQRIQQGQVLGLPTFLTGPGSQMGQSYESYADALARTKKQMGLREGGMTGGKTYHQYHDQYVPRDEESMGYANGGRVGLFMGGDPLTGQALAIYNSMNAYGFDDQEIANALESRGYYTPGGTTTTPPEQVTGIINQQINQGGDDKPMIQSFKKDSRVAPAFEAFQADQQLQSMGIDNPFANEANLEGAYYGDMMDIDLSPGKQSKFAKVTEGLRSIPGKVKGMMDNPLMNAIGFAVNPLVGGIKGIASLANQMLPVNKRAIAENIGGNMGISVDNIGRIVNTGNYQDPSNVMAGYNLNMLTDKSFDKRIDKTSETLANKYDLNKQQISDILSGKLTEENFTDDKYKLSGTDKTTNLIKQLRSLQIMKDQNQFIQDTAKKEAEQKELAKQLARAQKEIAAKGYQDYGSGGASEATQKSYEGPDGSYAGASTQDYGGGEKEGGLIGYQKGGLATMFTRKR